ncbi:hypothetical protein Tco_1056354, partial [Tanacetum coccineum]
GCVFEDVKFTNVVGLEKLRLDLEEIVKFFTHGERKKWLEMQRRRKLNLIGRKNTYYQEIENNKEDVKLPSLNLFTTIVKDIIITPLKESGIEHSRCLALITKFVASPRSKGKSVKLPSFRNHDDDLDLMLVSNNEVDEPTETDEATGSKEIKVVDNSWITCGIREYSLLLTRKVNSGYGHMNLEAKYDKKRLRRKEKEFLYFAATAASMSAQPKGNTFVEKGTQNHCATDYCERSVGRACRRSFKSALPSSTRTDGISGEFRLSKGNVLSIGYDINTAIEYSEMRVG